MDFSKLEAFKDIPLPELVVADVHNLAASENTTLRRVSDPISFPLSAEDTKDIYSLVLKFKSLKDIAGLAAPQIGISKRVFVFEVPNIYENQKPFPFSVWINPSFEKASEETYTDFEECFSVKDMTGPVPRWVSVHYKAYNMEGQLVQGTTEGIAARVIQHETDHLDGILFVDYVPEDSIFPSAHLHQLSGILQENEDKFEK